MHASTKDRPTQSAAKGTLTNKPGARSNINVTQLTVAAFQYLFRGAGVYSFMRSCRFRCWSCWARSPMKCAVWFRRRWPGKAGIAASGCSHYAGNAVQAHQ